jgi:hypothetical protein
MTALDKTKWEILNATADDCENLEQIYRQVCYELCPDGPGERVTDYVYRPLQQAPFLSEIANGIRILVEQGFLTIAMDEEGRPWQGGNDLSYVWRAWFRMTATGRSAWESSEYLVEQE